VDGQDWKALRPEEPLIKELRLLCRDEVTLIEQRTAFVNQLRHALAEYYPAALEAFEVWTSVSAWMFLQRFPTPELLAQAGKGSGKSSCTAVGSGQRPGTPTDGDLRSRHPICWHRTHGQAKSLLALSLVQMLFTIEKQLALYRQQIEALFARHPDHDLFGSLPWCRTQDRPAYSPRLGMTPALRRRSPNLQCLAGSCTVTKRSGKQRNTGTFISAGL